MKYITALYRVLSFRAGGEGFKLSTGIPHSQQQGKGYLLSSSAERLRETIPPAHLFIWFAELSVMDGEL